jgi:chemotaxis protein CheD
MEFLINEILKYGGERHRLEIKIFGGSSSIEMSQTDIGQKNIDFVMNYLKTECLNVLAADVGGTYPRKIIYFPDTGVVLMKRLREFGTHIIERRERDYMHHILQKNLDGDVVLF